MKRRGTSAARVYARALFEVAREAGCVPAVRDDLAGIGALVRVSRELKVFLSDYTIPRTRRRTILEQAFRSQVQPLTWRMIRFLESRRRSGLLGVLDDSFAALCRNADGVKRVCVTTADPVDPAWLAALTTRLRQRVGGPVELEMAVKPSLMGGFTVQVEDVLTDWSVAGSLRASRWQIQGGKGAAYAGRS
ncbi:MAG: ATP synthase F1 subunit delta [Lentisphaerae bacterium RIFOXYC12_FULL_60_16]|nr:MAG: ATP synthase F1 subunit delta [Lentisphaerae bacterium RIFOXYC12_FULL_60_16]OGV73701.1 MAG: ATP synthase F1 subunit delta [Lentisphaerae bacterium RIFOXYA12_FULL_60_10]OGV75066.1 MAG: ATP synthase F1 subunit delta [Lentisphaerae bacterium RIFOXYB12_FULL_60_10]